MSQRRRFKQSISLKDRLANFAEEALKKASNLPPGTDREEILKKGPPGRYRVPHGRMGPFERTAAADPEQRRTMKAIDDRTMANLDVALEELVDPSLMEAITTSDGRSHKSCSTAPCRAIGRCPD